MFLLDLDPELGPGRRCPGQARDRMEDEILPFQRVLDASRGMAEIGMQIQSSVDSLLQAFILSSGSGRLKVG